HAGEGYMAVQQHKWGEGSGRVPSPTVFAESFALPSPARGEGVPARDVIFKAMSLGARGGTAHHLTVLAAYGKQQLRRDAWLRCASTAARAWHRRTRTTGVNWLNRSSP